VGNVHPFRAWLWRRWLWSEDQGWRSIGVSVTTQNMDLLTLISSSMEILKIKGGKKRVAPCDPATLAGCNKKETEFVTKHKESDVATMKAELQKLTDAKEGSTWATLKASVQDWISRRKVILEKMVATKEGKTEL
jgi:hypothetical protein